MSLRTSARIGAILLLTSCSRQVTVGLVHRDGESVNGDEDARAGNPANGDEDSGTRPVVIDDCADGSGSDLDGGTRAALIAGTGATTEMRWLYPYDGTVFPNNLQPPILMWDGARADAVYVRLRSKTFDYRGCLEPTGPNQLGFPLPVWQAAARESGGASDPFQLELTVRAGGAVVGPISEQVIIANGALEGSVYYMVVGLSSSLASVERIRGQNPAVPFLGGAGCTGCHSASADGTRFLAYSNGLGGSFTFSASDSAPAPLLYPTAGGEFSGFYPDGSLYVATAHPGTAGPRSYGGSSVTNAGLYATATGALIGGSGIPPGAMTPAFSPDGALLAFNDVASGQGHGLSVMRFSAAEELATQYRALYTDPSNYPAWPTFLPDDAGLVFSLGTAYDFSGMGAGFSPDHTAAASDLFVLDVARKSATLLARAMGFSNAEEAAANVTTLPFGASDVHHAYYPSVSPVASGGYAWVLFDSLRNYGNAGLVRQIWGAALDVSKDGTYTADPSHPAFYLPGQNIAAVHFRAVAVKDPCLPDGYGCSEGVVCCSGSCTLGVCAAEGR